MLNGVKENDSLKILQRSKEPQFLILAKLIKILLKLKPNSSEIIMLALDEVSPKFIKMIIDNDDEFLELILKPLKQQDLLIVYEGLLSKESTDMTEAAMKPLIRYLLRELEISDDS